MLLYRTELFRGGSVTRRGPMMNPRELPLSRNSQERPVIGQISDQWYVSANQRQVLPVAIVLWWGGNQVELTTEGRVTANGPMLPLIMPPSNQRKRLVLFNYFCRSPLPMWAKSLKINPDFGWCKNIHCKHLTPAPNIRNAAQTNADTLNLRN